MKKNLLIIPLLLTLVACTNDSPELPGVFTVGKNKQIQFSPGLLQYRASTNTWRFAGSQLEFIGENNAKISSTYNGWIDLFGYGCSGYDDKYPWQISNKREDYAPTGDDGITGTEYDWGIHCQIQNGGPKGSWRLPTCDDWYWILSRRENYLNLATLVYVETSPGLLIFPDGWENTTGIKLQFPVEKLIEMEANPYLAEHNHLTKAQWKKLEKTGAVFVSIPGYRQSVFSGPNPGPEYLYREWTNYWCSTSLYAGAAPWYLTLGTSSARCVEASYWVGRGYPVRLVKDVQTN